MPCEECFRASNGKPRCAVCVKPVLEDANFGVWQAWGILHGTPLVVGMGSYLGADLGLSEQVFEYMEVPMHERLFWLQRLIAINSVARKFASEKEKR